MVENKTFNRGQVSLRPYYLANNDMAITASKTLGIMTVLSLVISTAVTLMMISKQRVIQYDFAFFLRYMLPKAVAYMVLPLFMLGINFIIASLRKKPASFAMPVAWTLWAVFVVVSISADLTR